MSLLTVVAFSMGMMMMPPSSIILSMAVSIGRIFGRMPRRMMFAMNGM